jgi:chitin synthase
MFTAEKRKRHAKSEVEDIELHNLKKKDKPKFDFWVKVISENLKPVSPKFVQKKDVHKSLQSLRNMTLAILLLINMMWIMLLSTLNIWQLQQYGIDPRAFQLLFLAVYSLIIMIQFFAMLVHRGVTLVHHLGRVRSRGETVCCFDCLQEPNTV